MKEHPIPQDVTGYKFHIVGNMTLGQFMQVGAGAALAFAIYSTNLYDIVKWPLVLFVFGLGAMTAFIPIGERPISHWLTTFAKILYKPTQFYWRRDPVIPDFFNFVSSSSQTVVLPELDLSPLRRQKIHEYIVSSKVVDAPDQENLQVQAYVDHISELFSTSVPTTAANVVAHVQRPNLKVRLRSIRSQPSTSLAQEVALNTAPTSSDQIEPIIVDASTTQADASQQMGAFTQNRTALEVSEAFRQTDTQVTTGVDVPAVEQPIIEPTLEIPADPDLPQSNVTSSDQTAPSFVQPADRYTTADESDKTASTVTFNAKLPFPLKPTTPNKLVGMVLTPTDKLVEGAIVEIHARDGAVARAVRTNALGQFFVTTPLKSDTYIINVDKDGFQFKPLSIKLTGKIVDPIEIRSV